jgi:6-pyruvoyltetrahydropterin/6-carboxytetrahydropterin synthase
MTITATRRLQFAIGHRVHKHESKCRALHGHNFVFYLTAVRDDGAQDPLGRVIDFGVLKERLGGWIERMWDHGFVLWDADEDAIAGVRMTSGHKLFLLPYNPTAENLAHFVLTTVGPEVLRGTGVRLVRVTVHETENGIAEVAL